MSWISDYTEWAETCTDAPRIFHRWTGLSAVSSAVGRDRYLRLGNHKLHTNLWLILVAPSSAYRKSTCLSLAKSMVAKGFKNRVLPDDWSVEAFISILERNPVGTLYNQEFYTFTAMLNRSYMESAKPLLTELYDVPSELVRHLQSGTKTVDRPCVGILSATTVDWMLSRMKEEDFAGGFIPRFVLIPAFHKQRTMSLPEAADADVYRDLVRRLKELAPSKPGEMTLTDEARAFYHEWYKQTEDKYLNTVGNQTILSGYYHRLMTSCLKVAMLVAVDEGRDTLVDSPDMITATEWCDEVLYVSSELLSDDLTFTKDQRDRRTVLNLIKGSPEGITRTNLIRTSRLSKNNLDRVVESLLAEERIEDELLDSTAGRRATMYRLSDG